jgi:glycerophosphoryl diester phosphodiesterase
MKIRKYIGWLLSGSLLTVSAQPESASGDNWNLRDHIPLQEVIVQAHRGAGMLAPESSMEAFEITWALGAVPEADVRTTRDGVIVSFHDGDFSRILPEASEEMKKKGIQDLTFEEVKKLDIGAWKGATFEGQRVLSLSDIVKALTAHPERRVYVDIKNVDFVQLAKETEGVHPQLIIASTQYDELKRWKEVAPRSFTLHWMGGSEAELGERLDRLEEERFQDIDQLQIHVRIGTDGALSPGEDFLRRSGERLRPYGILYQTFPWECDDADVFWRLMDLGVASFATDYPDVTVQAVREYYSRRAGQQP